MTPEQRAIADRERPKAICQVRAFANDECSGPLQVSHPKGRKVQYRWMWCWSCEYHHMGDGKNNERDMHVIYQQATDADLRKFKLYEMMKQEKSWLEKTYGQNGSAGDATITQQNVRRSALEQAREDGRRVAFDTFTRLPAVQGSKAVKDANHHARDANIQENP